MRQRKHYWLMKSEPESFSISDLERVSTEPWSGVRNYQARNFMRQMQPGDEVFFYHSNTEVTGIYGIAEVASLPYPDPTQFDEESHYFDPKATQEQPRWDLVDVRFVRHFSTPVTLAAMKAIKDELGEGFALTQTGSRLSVIPVTLPQWKRILKLETQG